MRVIAALQADLEVSSIGTRSRLAEEIAEVPVLRRTVERLARVPSLERIVVLVPTGQRQRCEKILDGSQAEIVEHNCGPAAWSALIRSARKWSLDGWRGGIGGATSFDEYVDCRLLAGLLDQTPADAILAAPAAAPLLDPDLTERLVAHRRAAGEEIRLAFSPVPPGVTGIVLDSTLIRELAASNLPVGWLFGYQPSVPRKDLVFQECCMEAPPSLRFESGRLIADTEDSMRRIAALLKAVSDPDTDQLSAWLRGDSVRQSDLPREVEIELTTDEPYPESQLHPRGKVIPTRGPIDLHVVRRIASEMMSRDDALVVLGGFGDPLGHAEFQEVLSILRPENSPGVFGLCVRTRAVNLSDEIIDYLIAARVDVLNIILDAWTPELYARLASPNRPDTANLGSILARIDRLNKVREQKGSAVPIIVPEFTKSRLNVHEMDDFFDGWLRRLGAASIVGHSNRAGQVADLSLLNMAPSPREACRRIQSRLMILSDGRVAACDQDFRGSSALGDLKKCFLREIWAGQEFAALKEAHRTLQWQHHPLCAACNEWHRP